MAYDGKVLRQATLRFDEDKQRRQEQQRQRQQQVYQQCPELESIQREIRGTMGEIIADLSQTMQVVDITHLPQVASKGDTHFVVYKDAEGSHIRRLDPEERITEIAKMLSGSQITEAALAQARILLKP